MAHRADRVVTAKLPNELAVRLDEIAHRIDRSKNWIIRQALGEWLGEEQRRYELTLEALKSADEGRLIGQDAMEEWVEERKRMRAEAVALHGAPPNSVP